MTMQPKKKQQTIADALIEMSRVIPEKDLGEVCDTALHLLGDESRNLHHFPDQVIRALQVRDGVVFGELATPTGDVGEEERKKLIALIEKNFGRVHANVKVQMKEIKDPKLIGGAVLTIGDERYDVSIRTALDQLVDHLLTSMLPTP